MSKAFENLKNALKKYRALAQKVPKEWLYFWHWKTASMRATSQGL